MRLIASVLLAGTLTVGCGGNDPTDPSNPSAPPAYIRGDVFDQLVIELDGVVGRGPRAGVVDRLTEALGSVLDKPGGISVMRDEDLEASAPDKVWTFSELNALAQARFDAAVPEGTATFHTLWLDGQYENAGVLGVAWSNRYLAMFSDVIDAGCRRPVAMLEEALCQEAEAVIWLHEAGHVIGLVNNGVAMVEDHEDPEHPRHTSDEDGVMYWAYEGSNVFTLLESRRSGEPLGFGPASTADLAAFQAE